MKNRRIPAFSLIEILIAIAIMALAASLVYPIVTGNRDRAAYELSVINLSSVAKAMEHHYLEKGVYPVAKNWEELSGPESPLADYLNEVPKTDEFQRPYVLKESTPNAYKLEGFAVTGRAAKDYPDYSFSTGGKFTKKTPGAKAD